jgi:hypothetical protein
MVRPAAFGFNPETASSNAFQREGTGDPAGAIQAAALREFDQAVGTLRERGIDVLLVEDTPHPPKTDAVFPNNWLSTHANGLVVTWPMMAASRRNEVRQDVIEMLMRRFETREYWPLHEEAVRNRFVEGTGSLVLDRTARIAWVCRSPRSNESLVLEFCKRMKYEPMIFSAVDSSGKPIYHTNVMMAVLSRQAVVCLECVPDAVERQRLGISLERSGLELIEIGTAQMERFAANVLQIARSGQEPAIVLSATAAAALSAGQRARLERDSGLVVLDIPTIERHGGGSVRCMLAEIFLRPRPV